MKKVIFILFLLSCLFGSNISVQASPHDSSKACSGIYITSQDYKQGKLSFSCDSLCTEIKLNHFFSGNYVVVKCKGKKYRLNKDSVFGYTNGRHEHFRFYKSYDEEYKIIEAGNIIVYSYPVKIWTGYGRFIRTEQRYFFSKTADSPILPLTVLELKRAFPENLKFHTMLDLQFGNIQDIKEGDIFKINELLNKSNK